jgi:3-oxoadipate enol-lactonase
MIRFGTDQRKVRSGWRSELRSPPALDPDITRRRVMPVIARHATRIHYEVTGEGPTIALMHSFLCDGTMWRHQVEPLAEAGWQVVNIDMRGHGRSGPSLQPFSIYDLADDVIAVLDDVGAAESVWCGLSIGGMTSLRAAVWHPDRVRALVLADSDGGAEETLVKAKYLAMDVLQRAIGPKPLFGSVDKLFFCPTTRCDQPELVDALHVRFEANHRPSISTGIRALIKRDDVLPLLASIDLPALVVVGHADEALPPERSERLAEALPNAELVRIEGAGHLSCLERPKEFNDALLAFLEDLG